MNYPNKIKREYHKNINYANRGMDLENLLNDSNKYYNNYNLWGKVKFLTGGYSPLTTLLALPSR